MVYKVPSSTLCEELCLIRGYVRYSTYQGAGGSTCEGVAETLDNMGL